VSVTGAPELPAGLGVVGVVVASTVDLLDVMGVMGDILALPGNSLAP
jgi:hypothetical protein